MERRIHESAYKHGESHADITHAIHFAKAVHCEEEEDRMLYLGPNEAGNMIEVIALLEDEDELVVHAMAMRRKYRTLLRRYGDPDA